MTIVITVGGVSDMKKRLRMNTQYIDFYLQKNGLRKEEFCEMCDLSLKELESIYAQKNVEIHLVIKVVDVLNISSDIFLFNAKRNYKKL